MEEKKKNQPTAHPLLLDRKVADLQIIYWKRRSILFAGGADFRDMNEYIFGVILCQTL